MTKWEREVRRLTKQAERVDADIAKLEALLAEDKAYRQQLEFQLNRARRLEHEAKQALAKAPRKA